jgi:hypothetical protein
MQVIMRMAAAERDGISRRAFHPNIALGRGASPPRGTRKSLGR